MKRPTLNDLLREIDLILNPSQTPRSFEVSLIIFLNALWTWLPLALSLPFSVHADQPQALIEILDNDHENSLLAQWMSVKPCQSQPLASVAWSNPSEDEIAGLILNKLSRHPHFAEATLTEVHVEGQNLIQGILKAVLVSDLGVDSSELHDLDQLHRIDTIRELCEAALPYALYGELLFSELLLREVAGNPQDVPRPIWNRRVKALFSTQDLSALAKIKNSHLDMAYENWKEQMQSKDHFDAMTSIHIAASLCHLAREQVLSAEESDQVELPPALSDWIAQAQDLFVPPKGSSTVKATFLRTLKAVTEAVSSESIFNLEMTAMARDILAVVDCESFEKWDKESDLAVQKLKHKLLEPDIPPAIMTNAFCVLLCGNTLSKPHFSTRFIMLFEPIAKSVLLQPQLFSTNEIKSPEEFVGLLVELLPTDPEEPVSKTLVSHCLELVLSAIFDLCRPANLSVKTSLGIEWALLFLAALDKHMAKNNLGYLASIFCSVVREIGFPHWWTINLSNPGNPRNCAGMKACPHSGESTRQRLCIRLSKFFNKFTPGDEAIIPCSEIIQTQAQVQIDQATPERSWNVCQFGRILGCRETGANLDNRQQWPHGQSLSATLRDICEDIQLAALMHVNERTRALQSRCDNVEQPLREEKEKSSELKRVLKDTEADLAELEQTHQIVKADFSRLREGQAFLLQRGRDLSTSLQNLRLEREQLQEQLSTSLQTMANQNQDLAGRLEQIIRDTHREVQDRELANRGAELLRQEDAEIENLVKEDLETQIEWLREQLDVREIEMKECHDKEVMIMKDQFTRELATMRVQVSTHQVLPSRVLLMLAYTGRDVHRFPQGR
jgi:hypothetical protein